MGGGNKREKDVLIHGGVVVFVVIFRARIRNLDAEYHEVARRMRDLALTQFGCVEFHSLSEGDNEVSLSYWPSEENIRAWKSHPEHVQAQQAGRQRWYASYSVEVARIGREYRVGP
jgi:heme-degrading monooxygenase HmoA